MESDSEIMCPIDQRRRRTIVIDFAHKAHAAETIGGCEMVETLELITVRPKPGGWSVACEARGHTQMFQSGATAEAAARQLGAAIARGGQAAEIRIYLRDGSLAGRFACLAG
jgi:hypothetical protein